MKLPYIQAGEIVTTHGIRGEVKVLPWSDGPDFLCEFDRVRINDKIYEMESCRIQKTCNLVKLRGVDTVEEAQALRGKILEVFREDVPEGLIFADELIGMEVFSDGYQLGVITDVLDYPGNKVYVVEGEHSYMIPAVRQFILSTDLEKNVMQVSIIEGMRTDED